MDQGKNVSPQWAPDGRSIAFVSDRNGVSNIFLYDLERARGLPAHRLLHRRAGHHPAVPGAVAGPPRPIAWRSCTSRRASTTSTASPTRGRSSGSPTGRRRWTAAAILASAPRRSIPPARCRCATTSARRWAKAARSIGRRRASARRARWPAPATPRMVTKPVSIAALLDSADFSLPDTSEFTLKNYRVSFTPGLRGPAHRSATRGTTSAAASSAARPSR